MGLIRSASLTNFAEVARSVGLDPFGCLREFGLPQRCLRIPSSRSRSMRCASCSKRSPSGAASRRSAS